MTRCITLLAALALTLASFVAAPAEAQVRIRDVVDVEGVRQNDLVGYGIVVGLNGTGDSVRNSPFTEDSLTYMLERLGINVQGEEIKPRSHDRFPQLVAGFVVPVAGFAGRAQAVLVEPGSVLSAAA